MSWMRSLCRIDHAIGHAISSGPHRPRSRGSGPASRIIKIQEPRSWMACGAHVSGLASADVVEQENGVGEHRSIEFDRAEEMSTMLGDH